VGGLQLIAAKQICLKTILTTYADELALIIGNGINRYNSDSGLNSWDAMLLDLWIKHTDDDPKDIPLGISLTEFYDALDLSSTSKTKNLQKEFCDFLVGWNAKAHHQTMMAWAKRHSAPVLTTNFDETLSDCAMLCALRIFIPGPAILQREKLETLRRNLRFGISMALSAIRAVSAWG
jgi:hypothetical protein